MVNNLNPSMIIKIIIEIRKMILRRKEIRRVKLKRPRDKVS